MGGDLPDGGAAAAEQGEKHRVAVTAEFHRLIALEDPAASLRRVLAHPAASKELQRRLGSSTALQLAQAAAPRFSS